MTSSETVVFNKPIESFSSLIWRRFKKHRLALAALFILAFFALLSVCAGIIESFLGVSHQTASLLETNLVPGWPHILGTNELGQDVFTRLLFGGRISIAVGCISALTSAIIGSVIGLLAGYFGGRVDSALMRFTDAMLSVPVLPLMIVFAALDLNILFSSSKSFKSLIFIFIFVFMFYLIVRFLQNNYSIFKSMLDGLIISSGVTFGYYFIFFLIPWGSIGEGNFASVLKLILIIVFFGWMTVARLARASAMQLKALEFVSAAQALGASHKRILLSHILPNALAPIIVAATLEVGGNILYEAALSFLGLGVQPPVSSWGNMLNNALDYIKSTPSLAFWPGLFILITVACFNFLGDGMRDALDPHQVMKRASQKK